MLSNLHSFHFGALLQNSSALPWHIYNNTTNKLVLRQQKPEVISTAVKPLPKESTAVTTALVAVAKKPLKKHARHLSKKLRVIKAINYQPPKALPPSQQQTPQAPAQKKLLPNKVKPTLQTIKKTKPQWKPGPGVIEKIDKATGEIMHLAV